MTAGEKLKEVLPKLRGLGVTSASIEYNGSGDDGYFEDPVFVRPAGLTTAIPEEVKQAVLQALEDAVESQHGGWEINDGGAGTVTLDVVASKIEIDHNSYYTESQNFTTTLDI